jgi:hypothetical protein
MNGRKKVLQVNVYDMVGSCVRERIMDDISAFDESKYTGFRGVDKC